MNLSNLKLRLIFSSQENVYNTSLVFTASIQTSYARIFHTTLLSKLIFRKSTTVKNDIIKMTMTSTGMEDSTEKVSGDKTNPNKPL